MNSVFSILIALVPPVENDTTGIVKKKISDPWFSEDKIHHFAHSAIISSSALLMSNKICNIDKENSIYISFSIGITAGVSKEIYDTKTEDGSASFKDFIYDLAGVITGILLVSLGGL